MNFIKKGLILANILSLYVTSSSAFMGLGNLPAFQQKGLEEENTRLSVALFSSKPSEGDANIAINTQVGKMLNKNIEALVELNLFSSAGYTQTRLGGGANYYFEESKWQTETFTPYTGVQVGFNHNKYDTSFDDKFYVGAHNFIASHTAITPEVGLQFIDLVDYQEAYFNIYLTFFFDSSL